MLDQLREIRQNWTPRMTKQIQEAKSRFILEGKEAERLRLQRATEMGIDAEKPFWEHTDKELERIFEYGRRERLPVVTPLICNPFNIELLLSMFHCDRCGKCCQEFPPVPLQPYEPKKIADYLGVSHKAVKRKTICENGQRLLPIPCPFYDDGCSIQRVKPVACLSFPLVDPIIISGVALIKISVFCQASIRLCWEVAKLLRNSQKETQ